MTDLSLKHGYWQAPRRLRELLEDGEINYTDLGVLVYLALAGADRDDGRGVAVTHSALAAIGGVSTKTISRALGTLLRTQLLLFEVKQGQRKPIRVALGAAFVSEVVSEVEKVVSDVEDDEDGGGKPEGSAPPPPDQEVESTHTETETETEEAATHARAREVQQVLAAVAKPGYRLEKVTLERLVGLLEQHPDRDHLAEAHALADWELHGAGAKLQTKDGISRFRNWLKRAAPAAAQPWAGRGEDRGAVDYPALAAAGDDSW